MVWFSLGFIIEMLFLFSACLGSSSVASDLQIQLSEFTAFKPLPKYLLSSCLIIGVVAASLRSDYNHLQKAGQGATRRAYS